MPTPATEKRQVVSAVIAQAQRVLRKGVIEEDRETGIQAKVTPAASASMLVAMASKNISWIPSPPS